MNKIILMGRLTKDPEIRYTNANNTPVTSFTLAVNRRFNKPGEERQADFLPVIAWGKLAEFASKYFFKGMQISLVGRIQTRNWTDNEGKKRYVTEVVAEELFFADSKKENPNRDTSNNYNSQTPTTTQAPTTTQTPKDNSEEGFFPVDDGDDELPF